MDYHVAQNGASLGTLSEEAIASALAAHTLSPDDLCWREGMPDWQPLGHVFPMPAASAMEVPPPPPAVDASSNPAAYSQPPLEAPTAPTLSDPANPYAPPVARVTAVAVAEAQEFRDYAGFWIRLAAYLIDWLVTNLVAAGGGFVLGVALVATGVEDENTIQFGGSAIGILVSWLYYALMESSPKQATLGKMALGLVVTDLQRQRISFGRASGRYFGMILSGLLFGIGFLMCAWSERKQCLHDSMAGCLVFRKAR